MAELNVPVTKIIDIHKHTNADRLEIAYTNATSWPVIITKESFEAGDLVVYFPVDSVMPPDLEEIILGNTKMKLSNGRVRAAKIRQEVSYGIIYPLSKLQNHYPKLTNINLASDIKNILGVEKYEPPVKPATRGFERRKGYKDNPDFDKYINMSHIQQHRSPFQENEFVTITEKLHGTSFRAGYLKKPKAWHSFFTKYLPWVKAYQFCYGSRNVQLQDTIRDKTVYKRIVKQFKLKEKMKNFPGITIYGEIVGPGIQKGYTYGLKPGEIDLYVYDVKQGTSYVSDHRKHYYTGILSLKEVPWYGLNRWGSLKDGISEFFENNESFFGKDVVTEGIVLHSIKQINGNTHMKKYKLLNPEYLLNKENTDFH